MSDTEEVVSKLILLENRVESLENKEKDPWDKIQVIVQSIGSVLIPVTILLASHFLSREISQQQVKVAETSANAAQIQASVDQALAIKDLVQLLTDSDKIKREYGVKAVQIALRQEDAEELLTIVAKIDTNPEVKKSAKETLESIIQRNFIQLFSSIKSERSQALNALTKKEWQSSDAALIEFAITYAEQNLDSHQGIINTLYVFRKMTQNTLHKSVLLRDKQKLKQFLDKAAQSSNKHVKDFTKQVRSNLPDLG